MKHTLRFLSALLLSPVAALDAMVANFVTSFYAVHGIANILSKRGKFDDALAALKLVDHEKAGGFWHDQFRLRIAGTLQAAGRKDEALAAYREIIADKSSDPRLRKVAEESLASLSKGNR